MKLKVFDLTGKQNNKEKLNVVNILLLICGKKGIKNDDKFNWN